MTYTPEPWKAHDEETHWAIYANGNHLVARIPIRKSSWESDKDNALLIESAPALRAQNRTLVAALEEAWCRLCGWGATSTNPNCQGKAHIASVEVKA